MIGARGLGACGFLVALHLLALSAGALAPHDPARQDRARPYAPPTRVHFVDEDGALHARPFVYRAAERPGSMFEYEEDRRVRYPLRFLTHDQGQWRLVTVDEPARLLLLGTDGYGRDQLSRLLHGARISLFAGLLAAIVSQGIGLGLGAVAGFYGGWLDLLVMRASELFLALPWLYLLLAVRASLPLHVGPTQAFALVFLVIGLVDWAKPARLVRGVALSVRERDYVTAARGFGATDLYLLTRHVLPETTRVMATQMAASVPQYILAEVTLSFLGLGVVEPVASWGNMLAELQHYHALTSCWWLCAPGVALVLVSLAYQVLADADAEPRTQLAAPRP